MEIKLKEDKLNSLNIRWTNATTITKVLDISKREADILRIKHVFKESNLAKKFELDDHLNLLFKGKVVIQYDVMALKKLTNSQLYFMFINYASMASVTNYLTNKGEF